MPCAYFCDIQVAGVQSEFQTCSHKLSQKVWEELSELGEKRHQEKNKRMGIQERETNDILEEEARIG